MKIFHSVVFFLLLLCACVAPEPISQISFEQQLERKLNAGATIALSVDITTGKSGSSWSMSPEDFALNLERKLEFQLIESGLVHQIVEPDDAADHDMKVTITDFKHDVIGLPGGDNDRLNRVAADVILTERGDRRQLAAYDIRAEAGSEAAYGNQQDGAGLNALLEVAAQSILEGLQGKTKAADL
ncbi:MAG: hypothetical protein ACR2RA_13915 [Geminicoccaceae bacterium]